MSILVTGCYGFIGSHVCKALLKEGHEVIGVDKYVDAISYKRHRIEELKDFNKFNFIDYDLQDIDDILAILGNYQVEKVIHLAGQYSVGHTTANVKNYIKGNLIGFSNVLEAARIAGIKRFVYASSTFASNTNPSSMYGSTKLYNEFQAKVYNNAHGMECIGLRYGSTYGPQIRPDVGIYQIANHLIKNHPMQIRGGFQYPVHFIYISDAVGVTIGALETDKATRDVYTLVANDVNYDLMEVYNLLSEYSGRKVELLGEYLPVTGFRTDYTEQNKVLWDELNFSPNIKMNLGLQVFWDWFEEEHS